MSFIEESIEKLDFSSLEYSKSDGGFSSESDIVLSDVSGSWEF